MSCLIQLASVMGEVLEPGRSKEPVSEDPTVHELYVQTFVEILLQLFAEYVINRSCLRIGANKSFRGIQTYEMLPLSTAVYRIVTFHPVCFGDLVSNMYDACSC